MVVVVAAVTEVVAVDTEAAWAEAASMAVDLVVAGASTAAVAGTVEAGMAAEIPRSSPATSTRGGSIRRART